MKLTNKNRRIIITTILVGITGLGFLSFKLFNSHPPQFNEYRAYKDVIKQLQLGPRIPGSDAHEKTVANIRRELLFAGWKVEIQETEMLGHPIRNIVAKRGSGSKWVILAAHYDSRFYSDRDPDESKKVEPVPGANDGASGVAVLLELARVIPRAFEKEVWLVFFDAEDQGKIPGWDWILGSRAFVNELEGMPDAVVVVDMIGDANLNVHKEVSSDDVLADDVWRVAAELGYAESIINSEKYNILDDHLPFLEAGIPAIDMIDFDYPYWHTTNDTEDKVSSASLKIIGDTLLHWLQKD